VAQEAEQTLLRHLPAKADEDFFNTRLLFRLEQAAQGIGTELTGLLGYDDTIPFEVGLLETEKQNKMESNTGADIIVIVYLKLENGKSHTRAALIQGKIETADYVTNVFREATADFARNHQIKALTARNRHGYYFVYPTDRVARPIIAAPASDFLNQLCTNNPAVDNVSLLRESRCAVRTDVGGVDLATFFGRVLFKKQHQFKTVGDALKFFGQPVGELGARARDTASLLAQKLVLFEVGGRIPELDMKLIKQLGFSRTPPERDSDYSGPLV
jgi:hypothetical protein